MYNYGRDSEQNIKDMQKLVDYFYENDISGISILKTEEKFDNLYQVLFDQNLRKKLSTKEAQEFWCLEYEYELLYVFRYMNDQKIQDKCMQSLFNVLKHTSSHERIDKLIHRLFQVSDQAIIKQKDILQKCKKDLFKIYWVWEAFAKEYYDRSQYKLALECYWRALDGYVKLADSKNEIVLRQVFYDGKASLYISDVIYRIYGLTNKAKLWTESELEFSKRQDTMSEYSYFCTYYAEVLLHSFYQAKKKDCGKLEIANFYLNKIDNSGCDIGTFEVKCAVLYELGCYKDVIKICQIAVENFGNSKKLAGVHRFAYFANIKLLYQKFTNAQIEEMTAILDNAVSHIDFIPISALDGAKCFFPIFEFYHHYRSNIEHISKICIGFFMLLEKTNLLRDALRYCGNGMQLGYYDMPLVK